MKKNLLYLLMAMLIVASCSDDDNKDSFKFSTTFDGLLSANESEFQATGGEVVSSEWGYNYYKTSFEDKGSFLEFAHYYSDYGFAGGFTYTNKTDKTTPGYTNISAITGGAKNGNTYLTAYIGYTPVITIIDPDHYAINGLWVTNSTYAYLAMKDGNDGYKNETLFENGDWFKLTITGYKSTNTKVGSIDFYLADYRNNKTEIVNEWKWIDLTSLHDATRLEFGLSSSDTDADPLIGMNTPGYFCLDGVEMGDR